MLLRFHGWLEISLSSYCLPLLMTRKYPLFDVVCRGLSARVSQVSHALPVLPGHRRTAGAQRQAGGPDHRGAAQGLEHAHQARPHQDRHHSLPGTNTIHLVSSRHLAERGRALYTV